MLKKPTGKLGFIRLSFRGAVFKKINFPELKGDTEKFVFERFTEYINNQNLFLKIESYKKNSEDDIDFSVKTSIGEFLLDLQEIVRLEKGGYETGSPQYSDLEFSAYVFEKIMAKSLKYRGIKTSIMLLTYVTDFKFNLSDLVIQHLQYLLNKNEHGFKMIFYFSLLNQQEGYGHVLFPSDIRSFDEENYRNNITINLV